MPKLYPILVPLRLSLLAPVLLFWAFAIFLAWLLRLQSLQEMCIWLSCASVARCLGIRVKVKGKVADARPLLLVSNHFTYLDVYVLGCLLPLHFTPKSDVATWPLVGFFCRCIGCIFIDRRMSQTKANQAQLIAALQRRWIISLFPESTTNNGTALLPFASSYFSLAEAPHHVPVQPASVRYTQLGGKPMRREWLSYVGWYGDMTFLPHFLQVLSIPSLTAEVEFHPLLVPGKNRKELAVIAQTVITKALER